MRSVGLLVCFVVIIVCIKEMEGYQKGKVLKGTFVTRNTCEFDTIHGCINTCQKRNTVAKTNLEDIPIALKGLKHTVSQREGRTKRDIDNHINSIPEQDPRSMMANNYNDVGMQLMDEFLYFLSLKETGLLDFCMGGK